MLLHPSVYALLLLQRFFGHAGTLESPDSWPLWANAMVFGFFSAISLPVGAICGIIFSPVPQPVVAGWLAFGAGCLLFAVTVELYGEALTELEHEGYAEGSWEICITVGFAIVGAWGYIMLNRWMEHVFAAKEEAHSTTESGGNAEAAPPTEKSHLMAKRLKSAVHLAKGNPGGLKAAAEGGGKATPNRLAKAVLVTRDKMELSRGRNKALLRALHDDHKEEDAAAHKDGQKEQGSQHGFILAMAMWLGVLVDGIPESILLGFLAAEKRLSLALVISLFIANFPESFSSGSLMKEAGIATWKIICMWTSLFLMTGLLAGFACWCLPQDGKGFHSGDNWQLHTFGAMIEGLAGGAMLACIASVMLPEAFEMRGDIVGLLCVIGFLLTVMIKVFGGYASELTGARERTAPIYGKGGHDEEAHHGGSHHLLFLAAQNFLAPH